MRALLARILNKAVAWVRTHSPLLLALLLFVVGVIAWLAGSLLLAFAGFSDARMIAALGLARDFGALLIVGGCIAAFTDFLRYTGLFRDVLVDVMESERTRSVIRDSVDVDHLLERRTDLPELWRRLTRRIYLGGIDTTSGRHGELSRAVERAIGRRFPVEDEFYYRRLVRTIVLTWADRSSGALAIREEWSFTVVPFRADRSCRYRGVLRGAENLSLDDYRHELDELWVGGKKLPLQEAAAWEDQHVLPAIGLIRVAGKNEGRTRSLTVDLPPGESFAFLRVRHMVQNVLEDPVLIRLSPGIVTDLELRVTCDAVGLRLQFASLGLPDDAMQDERGTAEKSLRPGDSIRRFRDVVLPDEGFLLTLWVAPDLAKSADSAHIPAQDRQNPAG